MKKPFPENIKNILAEIIEIEQKKYLQILLRLRVFLW